MKHFLILIVILFTCSFSFAADKEIVLINVVKEPVIIYVQQPQVIYVHPVYYQPVYYQPYYHIPRYHPHPRHNFRFSFRY